MVCVPSARGHVRVGMCAAYCEVDLPANLPEKTRSDGTPATKNPRTHKLQKVEKA